MSNRSSNRSTNTPVARSIYIWINLLQHNYKSGGGNSNPYSNPYSMNELGTIYDQWSVSRERALFDLGDLLRAVGFAVRKKSPTESTLRVYPRGHNTYPLLNPRFYESASEFGLLSERPCLVFDVLSMNQSETWSQRLSTFTGDDHCTFQATGEDNASGYRHHGHFVLPQRVDSASGSIEWSELKEPLARILRLLGN